MSISYESEKGKIGRRGWILAGFCSLLTSLGTASVVGGLTLWHLRSLRVPITVDPAPPLLQVVEEPVQATSTGPSMAEPAKSRPKLKLFVASKRGKSYYSLGCKGGTTIAPENQIWFETEAEAKAAGYTPSKSCKDLKPL
jgi:hypothetical protein